MSVFWRSKLIPEQYRKWIDEQFVKAVNTKPGIGNGTDAKGAVEDMVEDFKKTHETAEEKVENDKK
jgi:hypothetical protein